MKNTLEQILINFLNYLKTLIKQFQNKNKFYLIFREQIVITVFIQNSVRAIYIKEQ